MNKTILLQHLTMIQQMLNDGDSRHKVITYIYDLKEQIRDD